MYQSALNMSLSHFQFLRVLTAGLATEAAISVSQSHSCFAWQNPSFLTTQKKAVSKVGESFIPCTEQITKEINSLVTIVLPKSSQIICRLSHTISCPWLRFRHHHEAFMFDGFHRPVSTKQDENPGAQSMFLAYPCGALLHAPDIIRLSSISLVQFLHLSLQVVNLIHQCFDHFDGVGTTTCCGCLGFLFGLSLCFRLGFLGSLLG